MKRRWHHESKDSQTMTTSDPRQSRSASLFDRMREIATDSPDLLVGQVFLAPAVPVEELLDEIKARMDAQLLETSRDRH